MNCCGKREDRQDIPLIKSTDVIVVGGATAGVAAACSAAQTGAGVFLACSATYLGEDICATGRLWLQEGDDLNHPLSEEIFTDKAGDIVSPQRPMQVKRKLEEALLRAGVEFLYAALPADLLVDEEGSIGGVVLTGKSGPFAVSGRVVIDATPPAALAGMAGIPFSSWPGGTVSFTRMVAGHPAEDGSGCTERLLPGLLREVGGPGAEGCRGFEYTAELELGDWTPSSLAEAEHLMRDRTWHKDQLWSADRCQVTPPVCIDPDSVREGLSVGELDSGCFATSLDGLYVLGPCAALPRSVAAALQRAPLAISAGDRLGRDVARKLRNAGTGLHPPLKPMHSGHANGDEDVCEPFTGVRFRREALEHIPGPAGTDLQILGEFDVVVAGGGTGGAPAAIAAARSGGRVLLLESLHGLGGVGTLGYITRYYHGYRGGFTEEITGAMERMSGGEEGFNPGEWNPEHKSEWLRAELRKAGGTVWYGSTASGALMVGSRVCGVVVNTPLGRGMVRAGAVIDATGNADVAAAAGAECGVVSDSDLAVQGSGLPPRPLVPRYFNTDYTFIEDGDPIDVTRAFVASRRKFKDAFDAAQLPDSRERRQVKGDVTVTPLHAYTGATWHDTICLSRSNFDSHGFTIHPLFFIQPPDRRSLDVWLPLRALMPAGIEGLLVTGLAISAHRDVMPALRMQPDVQNHSYAAGLAAAEAAAERIALREINIRRLQRRLVDGGFIPASVLLHGDVHNAAGSIVRSAAGGELRHHSELAALMSLPEEALPVLKKRLATEQDREASIRCAKLLAFMGDLSGEDILLGAVGAGEWDEGWNFRGMGQFGRSMSPTDDCVAALAHLRSEKAHPVLLEKAGRLGASDAFSHFRAIALYAESAGGNGWAALLGELLEKPGIGGFSINSLGEALSDIPADRNDNSLRNRSLRELYLARALYRCGDPDGVAEDILRQYSRDIRGHYVRHAAVVLGS